MSSRRAMYRQLPIKGDPRVVLRVPKDIHSKLETLAKHNARTINEEIIARLVATINLNDEFMASDRIRRLIHCKKLAYKPRNNHHGLEHRHFVQVELAA